MKLRLVASSLTLATVIGLPAGAVFAQATSNSGYVTYSTGPANNNIVRSARYGTNNATCNLCWRTSYWTPAMAIAECDPDLVKRAQAPAPAPAPVAAPSPTRAPAVVAPAPAPAAPAPAPVVAAPPAPAPAPVYTPVPAPAPVVVAAPAVSQKITLASKALFATDSAVLKPEGQAVIDREIISRVREVSGLELVLVTGHTDRMGTQEYNQKLSERRAAAVAAYMASKGVARDKIETLGMGKTQPVPGVKCDMTNRKELVACLQPHRRVEVEIKAAR